MLAKGRVLQSSCCGLSGLGEGENGMRCAVVGDMSILFHVHWVTVGRF